MGRAINNSGIEIKVTQKGLNTIWAKTEAKTELPIDVEFGREYYLRCTVGMGLMVGRPKLELVNNRTGKAEFNFIKSN